MTEEELLHRLQDPQTKEQAFADLVRMYSSRLYWHIRKMVLNHEYANDLLQNTFLKAWKVIDQFRGESQIYTWLYQIATYETLSFIRRESRREEGRVAIDEENEYLISNLSGDPFFDGDATVVEFEKAILSLPEKQKLVFKLRYYDEMPYEEISQVTGTSVGALKATFHHAIKKIKKRMGIDN